MLLAAALAVACEPASQTAVGLVTEVQATPDGTVQSFTLETPEGQIMNFRLGRLERSGGGFGVDHLVQHMTLSQGVAVSYREERGELVAHRLVDAPWADG